MRNDTSLLIAKAHSVQQVIRLAMQHEFYNALGNAGERERIAKIAAARIGELRG